MSDRSRHQAALNTRRQWTYRPLRSFIDSQHQQNSVIPGWQTPFFAFFADPLRSLRLEAFYRKGRKESRKERKGNAACRLLHSKILEINNPKTASRD